MTSDQILAALRANVSLAIGVVDAFAGARPWSPQRHYLGDKHGEPTGDQWTRRSVVEPEQFIASAIRRVDGRWEWWHRGKPDRWRLKADDSAATAEEAMRLADAGLDAAGVAR